MLRSVGKTLFRAATQDKSLHPRTLALVSAVSPSVAVLEPSPAALLSVCNLLRAAADSGRPFLAITGAGVSTASGIPDYRSPGRKPYRPIQHLDFVTKPQIRRRYWARSFSGFPRMQLARPNSTHTALADLQARGLLSLVVTQNVDRLHHAAGSTSVLELHGTIHEVECLQCRNRVGRSDFQHTLAEMNEAWLAQFGLDAATMVRPDGDVELPEEAYESFVTPSCDCCGGMLKPAVVFHGDNVPVAVAEAAAAAVEKCGGLLVVGTTLTTFSSYKHAVRAAEHKKPIAILNAGVTRADHLASLVVHADCTKALPALVTALDGPRM